MIKLVHALGSVPSTRAHPDGARAATVAVETEVTVLPRAAVTKRSCVAIVEVAARNHLLKLQGHHSAKEFQDRVNREIAQARTRRGLGDEVE